mmetsp:Transcript_15557/g.59025  ORF Transcript_15557/g.59025 Transcript_15557/m.59025 type:complete len:317 (+) Transcript_15557:1723-2673(+)
MWAGSNSHCLKAPSAREGTPAGGCQVSSRPVRCGEASPPRPAERAGLAAVAAATSAACCPAAAPAAGSEGWPDAVAAEALVAGGSGREATEPRLCGGGGPRCDASTPEEEEAEPVAAARSGCRAPMPDMDDSDAAAERWRADSEPALMAAQGAVRTRCRDSGSAAAGCEASCLLPPPASTEKGWLASPIASLLLLMPASSGAGPNAAARAAARGETALPPSPGPSLAPGTAGSLLAPRNIEGGAGAHWGRPTPAETGTAGRGCHCSWAANCSRGPGPGRRPVGGTGTLKVASAAPVRCCRAGCTWGSQAVAVGTAV